MGSQLHRYPSHFSVTVIRHHDKSNLEKKVYFGYDSRGLEATTAGMEQQQEHKAGWSHCICMGRRANTQEVGQ